MIERTSSVAMRIVDGDANAERSCLMSLLEVIARQERELRLATFNSEIAWSIGSRLRELALSRGQKIAINVSRIDYTLFSCTVGETTLDNAEWVRRKMNTVRRFQRSSYAVGLSIKEKGTNLSDQYGLPAGDYAAHGGCFPIFVQGGGMIGTATVSGLPQRADHELVVEALCSELKLAYEEFAIPAEA